MQNETTRTIPLTQGQVAIVDVIDYDYLSQFNWNAQHDRNGKQDRWYAHRYLGSVRAVSRFTGKSYWRVKVRSMQQDIALRAGLPKSPTYDHKDGDGLNNRRENIRPATFHQNNANCRKRLNTTSRFKGVCWDKRGNRWMAQIQVKGNKIHLGRFTNEKEAAAAYQNAALKYFGEFSRFP